MINYKNHFSMYYFNFKEIENSFKNKLFICLKINIIILYSQNSRKILSFIKIIILFLTLFI